MKRFLGLLLVLFSALPLSAYEREAVWPKGKMPDSQPRQYAAMSNEFRTPGFNIEEHRTPYLEWYETPDASVRNGTCMILISGGAYNGTVDVGHIDRWHKELTAVGIQCVNLVYRTPRPEGLPYWHTAWEDGQRAVRLVRSEAKKRGFDPEKIGVIGMSAGSHLAVLLATSSLTPAYARVDKLDDIPCHINFAIANAPAYVTTDADELGIPAAREGYGADVGLSKIFKFDEKTCPMSLHHGGADPYSPNGSTQIYRQLRRMGIPAELHLYPNRGHGAYGLDRAIEFLRQMEFLGPLEPQVPLMSRFPEEVPGVTKIREDVWPEGKMPDYREAQCKPFLEWSIPAELKSHAIQIIVSGGSYKATDENGFEVGAARRYLNARGVAVVTLKYRTPRPEGLAKHTTAWEDLQRTIRIVRSEAASHGLDPNRIGLMGSSAGGHLTLMGVTSSRHRSYLAIDAIDRVPCNLQWGIGIYPAYGLTDGLNGGNAHGGNEDTDYLAPEFTFDPDTCPMLFMHGDADSISSMLSVKTWEKMRAMGIQSELHTLAKRTHCFQREASPGTGSYNWLDHLYEYLQPYLADPGK